MKPVFVFNFLLMLLCPNNSGATVILQYHHIADNTPRATSIRPRLFEQHLDYLSKNNFKVISLSKLLLHLKNQVPLPPKSVVITFDDSYRSIYDNAFPLLAQRKFPFTIFINTMPITNQYQQFMTWEQINEMADAGAEIANHTVNHAHLIRIKKQESKSEWRKRIRSEIIQAQRTLNNNVKDTIRALAYPYGEYNQSVKDLLREIGFTGFGQQSGAVSLNVDPQAIPRFPLGGNYGAMDDFEIKVNSLAMPIAKVRLYDDEQNRLNDLQLPSFASKPVLELILKDEFENLNVQCYAGGQGKLIKQVNGKHLWFRAKRNLPVGRSRYNCTAATGKKNQFYWFSQPWIKPHADGSWYSEPP